MTFICTDEQLGRVMKQHIKAAFEEKEGKTNPEHLHSIAKTAELLGKSYTTVCRMINQKRIVSTTDKKYVAQKEIDNYIGGNK